jgi:hypothetical protein
MRRQLVEMLQVIGGGQALVEAGAEALGARLGAVRSRRCMAGKACGRYGSGGLVATMVRSAPDRKEHTHG